MVLLLAADLGMLGYVRNARSGAATYNVCHTYLAQVVVAAAGLLASIIWVSLALI